MMLKYLSLILLMTQNTLHILTLRYVRTREGDMFMASTAVVVSEIIKLVMSFFIILYEEGGLRNCLKHLHRNIILQPKDCLKISIPSLVYTLQNNLLYLALSNLDAATFQVYYQLKILTTALFSVVMLKKTLSKVQWLSLALLFLGVSIVQMQTKSSPTTEGVPEKQQPLIGLFAVIVSCFMSGFAGVYFEKILKGTTQTVWLRNVQLGVLGTVIGYVTMEVKEGPKVHRLGFLFGYDSLVWIAILLQSLGGLVVAVVVKYADNILKGFATSFAIIASSIVSVYLFEFELTLQFCVGASLVILSIYLYGRFSHIGPPPVPVEMSQRV